MSEIKYDDVLMKDLAEELDRYMLDKYGTCLATEDRNHLVAAALQMILPTRDKVECACSQESEDHGGGMIEYYLAYNPACPKHSYHLWDPSQGMWIIRPGAQDLGDTSYFHEGSLPENPPPDATPTLDLAGPGVDFQPLTATKDATGITTLLYDSKPAQYTTAAERSADTDDDLPF
jgi:hypothetical protein